MKNKIIPLRSLISTIKELRIKMNTDDKSNTFGVQKIKSKNDFITTREKKIKKSKKNLNISNQRINPYLYLIFILLVDLIAFSKCKISDITLKIKGIGNKNLLNAGFQKSNFPNEIYINGKKIQNPTEYIYYFDKPYNYVKLIWNGETNNIKNLEYMFHECSDITEIDLSNFDTSEVTDMRYMFRKCSSLTSINLSNLVTSKVTLMFDMFLGCSLLTTLDLSSFDTSNVISMEHMFEDCPSLSSLDLSNFDFSQVTDIAFLFQNCINLEYINIKNFDKSSMHYSDDVFIGVPDNVVICMNDYSNLLSSQLDSKSCLSKDCSVNWKSKQNWIISNGNSCINKCSESTQYINEYNFKCFDDCENGFLLDENNITTNICKCELEQCLTCPPVPLRLNMCTKCNFDYYEIENDPLNIGIYINCYKDPIGY